MINKHHRHPDRSEAQWRDLFLNPRLKKRSIDFASLGMTG
jgi:hypothetical protein